MRPSERLSTVPPVTAGIHTSDLEPIRVQAFDAEDTKIQRHGEALDLPGLDRLKGAPLFAQQAFTRQLRSEQWRWYSHDPGTLRLIDADYLDSTI